MSIVGVRFAEETISALTEYMVDNKIPNPVDPEGLHITVLVADGRNLDEIEIHPKTHYVGTAATPAIFKRQDGEKNCLVLIASIRGVEERHEQLSNEYNIEHPFPSYIPHITLSYDIGDFDIESLPLFRAPIIVTGEYKEDKNMKPKRFGWVTKALVALAILILTLTTFAAAEPLTRKQYVCKHKGIVTGYSLVHRDEYTLDEMLTLLKEDWETLKSNMDYASYVDMQRIIRDNYRKSGKEFKIPNDRETIERRVGEEVSECMYYGF